MLLPGDKIHLEISHSLEVLHQHIPPPSICQLDLRKLIDDSEHSELRANGKERFDLGIETRIDS